MSDDILRDLGKASPGQSYRDEMNRQDRWMRDFVAEVRSLMTAPIPKPKWYDVRRYYEAGISPQDAARTYLGAANVRNQQEDS